MVVNRVDISKAGLVGALVFRDVLLRPPGGFDKAAGGR